MKQQAMQDLAASENESQMKEISENEALQFQKETDERLHILQKEVYEYKVSKHITIFINTHN